MIISKNPEIFYIESKKKVRSIARKFLDDVSISQIFVFLALLIFPPLGIFLWVLFPYKKYILFKNRFLTPREKYELYKKLLAPKMSEEHYFTIGYEVYEEDLDEHIRYLRMLSSTDKRVKQKALDYLKRETTLAHTTQRYRLVGFNKDQLTTHFWVIGTTGAGKTSLLMKIFREHMKQGGGLIFVDGKADEKMFAKLYGLAEEVGREQDVYLINFLNTDKHREHTNTINPLSNLSAASAVEFLSSLMGTASGDMAYWQERGRALLKPIVYFLNFRKLYFKENFSIDTISMYFEIRETVFILSVCYGMLLSLEQRLSKNQIAHFYYNRARSRGMIPGVVFDMVEVFRNYFRQYPGDKGDFEKSVGIKTDYIESLYESYLLMDTYLTSISPQLVSAGKSIGKELFKKFGNAIETLDLKEIKKEYAELVGKNKELQIALEDQKSLIQHSYATQQWTGIFSTLQMYSHIFGSESPEVDMVDVIRNNKILYVLLPPLKQSEKTTEILGKAILLAIRQAVATALGGPVELSPTQKDIVKERITPKPLGLVVLDEYGAYPLPGIDTLLAQVRSINISFILSTQDYTSARVEGKDENSVRRVWANTQKIILRVKDNETLDAIDKHIKEIRTMRKSGVFVEELGKFYEDPTTSVEGKEKVFDVKKLTDFIYGLSLIMTDEETIITQIEWADAKPSQFLSLTHLEEI